MEHPLTWFSLIPYIKDLPVHIVGAFFAMLLLIIISLFVHYKFSPLRAKLIPDERLTLSNIAELVVEMISNLSKDIIGDECKKYLPFI